jgi:hypothetical protein
MIHALTGQSLLDELDARQNALLDELDRLNARIEQAIAACASWRPAVDAPANLSAGAGTTLP